MQSERLIIRVDLQLSDLLRSLLWQQFDLWYGKLFLTAIPILLGLIFWRGLVAGEWNLLGVLVLIAYPLLIFFSAQQRYTQLQGSQKQMTYRVEPDGIDLSNADSATHVDWSAILRAAESSFDFYLFPQQSLFYLIPKRCFEPEDLAAFRVMLRRQLAERAQLKG